MGRDARTDSIDDIISEIEKRTDLYHVINTWPEKSEREQDPVRYVCEQLDNKNLGEGSFNLLVSHLLKNERDRFDTFLVTNALLQAIGRKAIANWLMGNDKNERIIKS